MPVSGKRVTVSITVTEGGGVRSGPGVARTILRFHIISARPSKQPLMVLKEDVGLDLLKSVAAFRADHTRLFRGPRTNDMKKWDGPSRSWPTPHTTPLFLPPEDPSQVIAGKE